MPQRDQSDVLRAALALARLTELDRFPVVALEALRALVPCEVITYNEVDPSVPRFVELTRPASFRYPAGSHQRFAELLPEHPLIAHHLRTGDGAARRISDFLDHDAYHASRLYQEVYAPMGVEHQLAVTIPAAPPLVIGIALSRRHRDFTDDEVARLDHVRPHLAAAYEASRTHTYARRLLDSTLGSAGHGLVACEGSHLEPMDDRARVQLDAWFAGAAARERLLRWVAEVRTSYLPVAAGTPAPTHVVARRAGRLVVRFLPGAGATDLLVLDEQLAVRAPTGGSGGAELGLRPRQLQVLQLVADGSTNAEIAAALHLSLATVKKHLERTYRQLGVANRTAAVARARQELGLA